MTALRAGFFSTLALGLLALTPASFAGAPKLPGYDAKADPQIDLSRALAEAKARFLKFIRDQG